ncbi:nucleolar protein [Anaeramoeba flamelloides]|uniref:Nucleolar protein n=1 Tax=Anaeramoeba flamelloides TaxID=1746091 RepID=A0ABQ8Y7Q1_9EUKA|nr:nucleolar protein [Anaeramoeba flamelloides]
MLKNYNQQVSPITLLTKERNFSKQKGERKSGTNKENFSSLIKKLPKSLKKPDFLEQEETFLSSQNGIFSSPITLGSPQHFRKKNKNKSKTNKKNNRQITNLKENILEKNDLDEYDHNDLSHLDSFKQLHSDSSILNLQMIDITSSSESEESEEEKDQEGNTQTDSENSEFFFDSDFQSRVELNSSDPILFSQNSQNDVKQNLLDRFKENTSSDFPDEDYSNFSDESNEESEQEQDQDQEEENQKAFKSKKRSLDQNKQQSDLTRKLSQFQDSESNSDSDFSLMSDSESETMSDNNTIENLLKDANNEKESESSRKEGTVKKEDKKEEKKNKNKPKAEEEKPEEEEDWDAEFQNEFETPTPKTNSRSLSINSSTSGSSFYGKSSYFKILRSVIKHMETKDTIKPNEFPNEWKLFKTANTHPKEKKENFLPTLYSTNKIPKEVDQVKDFINNFHSSLLQNCKLFKNRQQKILIRRHSNEIKLTTRYKTAYEIINWSLLHLELTSQLVEKEGNSTRLKKILKEYFKDLKTIKNLKNLNWESNEEKFLLYEISLKIFQKYLQVTGLYPDPFFIQSLVELNPSLELYIDLILTECESHCYTLQSIDSFQELIIRFLEIDSKANTTTTTTTNDDDDDNHDKQQSLTKEEIDYLKASSIVSLQLHLFGISTLNGENRSNNSEFQSQWNKLETEMYGGLFEKIEKINTIDFERAKYLLNEENRFNELEKYLTTIPKKSHNYHLLSKICYTLGIFYLEIEIENQIQFETDNNDNTNDGQNINNFERELNGNEILENKIEKKNNLEKLFFESLYYLNKSMDHYQEYNFQNSIVLSPILTHFGKNILNYYIECFQNSNQKKEYNLLILDSLFEVESSLENAISETFLKNLAQNCSKNGSWKRSLKYYLLLMQKLAKDKKKTNEFFYLLKIVSNMLTKKGKFILAELFIKEVCSFLLPPNCNSKSQFNINSSSIRSGTFFNNSNKLSFHLDDQDLHNNANHNENHNKNRNSKLSKKKSDKFAKPLLKVKQDNTPIHEISLTSHYLSIQLKLVKIYLKSREIEKAIVLLKDLLSTKLMERYCSKVHFLLATAYLKKHWFTHSLIHLRKYEKIERNKNLVSNNTTTELNTNEIQNKYNNNSNNNSNNNKQNKNSNNSNHNNNQRKQPNFVSANFDTHDFSNLTLISLNSTFGNSIKTNKNQKINFKKINFLKFSFDISNQEWSSISKYFKYFLIRIKAYLFSRRFASCLFWLEFLIAITSKKKIGRLAQLYYLRGILFSKLIEESHKHKFPWSIGCSNTQFNSINKKNENKKNGNGNGNVNENEEQNNYFDPKRKIFHLQFPIASSSYVIYNSTNDLINELINSFTQAFNYFHSIGDDYRLIKSRSKLINVILNYIFPRIVFGNQKWTKIAKLPDLNNIAQDQFTKTFPEIFQEFDQEEIELNKIINKKIKRRNNNNNNKKKKNSSSKLNIQSSIFHSEDEEIEENNSKESEEEKSENGSETESEKEEEEEEINFNKTKKININRISEWGEIKKDLNNQNYKILSPKLIDSKISLDMSIAINLVSPILLLNCLLNHAELKYLQKYYELSKSSWLEAKKLFFKIFMKGTNFCLNYKAPYSWTNKIFQILKRITRLLFCYEPDFILNNSNLIIFDSYISLHQNLNVIYSNPENTLNSILGLYSLDHNHNDDNNNINNNNSNNRPNTVNNSYIPKISNFEKINLMWRKSLLNLFQNGMLKFTPFEKLINYSKFNDTENHSYNHDTSKLNHIQKEKNKFSKKNEINSFTFMEYIKREPYEDKLWSLFYSIKININKYIRGDFNHNSLNSINKKIIQKISQKNSNQTKLKSPIYQFIKINETMKTLNLNKKGFNKLKSNNNHQNDNPWFENPVFNFNNLKKFQDNLDKLMYSIIIDGYLLSFVPGKKQRLIQYFGNGKISQVSNNKDEKDNTIYLIGELKSNSIAGNKRNFLTPNIHSSYQHFNKKKRRRPIEIKVPEYKFEKSPIKVNNKFKALQEIKKKKKTKTNGNNGQTPKQNRLLLKNSPKLKKNLINFKNRTSLQVPNTSQKLMKMTICEDCISKQMKNKINIPKRDFKQFQSPIVNKNLRLGNQLKQTKTNEFTKYESLMIDQKTQLLISKIKKENPNINFKIKIQIPDKYNLLKNKEIKKSIKLNQKNISYLQSLINIKQDDLKINSTFIKNIKNNFQELIKLAPNEKIDLNSNTTNNIKKQKQKQQIEEKNKKKQQEISGIKKLITSILNPKNKDNKEIKQSPIIMISNLPLQILNWSEIFNSETINTFSISSLLRNNNITQPNSPTSNIDVNKLPKFFQFYYDSPNGSTRSGSGSSDSFNTTNLFDDEQYPDNIGKQSVATHIIHQLNHKRYPKNKHSHQLPKKLIESFFFNDQRNYSNPIFVSKHFQPITFINTKSFQFDSNLLESSIIQNLSQNEFPVMLLTFADIFNISKALYKNLFENPSTTIIVTKEDSLKEVTKPVSSTSDHSRNGDIYLEPITSKRTVHATNGLTTTETKESTLVLTLLTSAFGEEIDNQVTPNLHSLKSETKEEQLHSNRQTDSLSIFTSLLTNSKPSEHGIHSKNWIMHDQVLVDTHSDLLKHKAFQNEEDVHQCVSLSSRFEFVRVSFPHKQTIEKVDSKDDKYAFIRPEKKQIITNNHEIAPGGSIPSIKQFIKGYKNKNLFNNQLSSKLSQRSTHIQFTLLNEDQTEKESEVTFEFDLNNHKQLIFLSEIMMVHKFLFENENVNEKKQLWYITLASIENLKTQPEMYSTSLQLLDLIVPQIIEQFKTKFGSDSSIKLIFIDDNEIQELEKEDIIRILNTNFNKQIVTNPRITYNLLPNIYLKRYLTKDEIVNVCDQMQQLFNENEKDLNVICNGASEDRLKREIHPETEKFYLKEEEGGYPTADEIADYQITFWISVSLIVAMIGVSYMLGSLKYEDDTILFAKTSARLKVR